MKTEAATVVRIYVRESEHLMEKVMRYLQDDAEVAGATVLRGIEGFTGGGELRTATLMDLSLDLPLVIEFFDAPERVEAVIRSLIRRFPLPHIVSWPAQRHFVKE